MARVRRIMSFAPLSSPSRGGADGAKGAPLPPDHGSSGIVRTDRDSDGPRPREPPGRPCPNVRTPPRPGSHIVKLVAAEPPGDATPSASDATRGWLYADVVRMARRRG